MIGRRWLFIAVLIGLCFIDLGAQDPHHSQSTSIGVLLNPALSGSFVGQQRLSMQYRGQWASVLGSTPFNTFSGSGEFKFNVAGDDYFSGHVRVLFDQVGRARYGQGLAHVGGSYMKKLSGGRGRTPTGQYIIGGAEFGYGQNSASWGDLWFGRQFDIGAEKLDLTRGSGEDNFGTTLRTDPYMDINVGFLWYNVLDENLSFHFGAAGHHLNQPSIGLLENPASTLGTLLYRKITIHGGASLGIGHDVILSPSAMAQLQGPSLQWIYGASIGYGNLEDGDISLKVGVWNRWNRRLDGIHLDSWILSFGFDQAKWSAGLSYDFTFSGLSFFNDRRGAFEMTFAYKRLGDDRKAIAVPQF